VAASLNGQHGYEDARQLLQDLQPGHAHLNVTRENHMAVAELGLWMSGEAEAGARATVAEAERLHGPAHYATPRAGTLLGSAIASQGRRDEARPLLEGNAEAWLEHFGKDHPMTVAADQELARCWQFAC